MTTDRSRTPEPSIRLRPIGLPLARIGSANDPWPTDDSGVAIASDDQTTMGDLVTERSNGTATFVFVPGAGGRAWYWHRVVAELATRGHGTVAVDLPAADDTADLDVYADTIVAAAAGRDRVVLVAQSMGGLSAPLACERLAASLLVFVNAMIPRQGETGAEWWEVTGQAQAAAEFAASQGRTSSDGLESTEVFLHDLPSEVLQAAVAAGEPDQSVTPFSQPFPLARWPEVPTRVVASSDDRLFPVAFQRRVATERLGIRPDEIAGGHLVALSQPVALAELLETYTTEVLDGSVTPAPGDEPASLPPVSAPW